MMSTGNPSSPLAEGLFLDAEFPKALDQNIIPGRQSGFQNLKKFLRDVNGFRPCQAGFVGNFLDDMPFGKGHLGFHCLAWKGLGCFIRGLR